MSDRNGIPVRRLGKTELEVTVLGVGGYHIGKDHDAALGARVIRTAIDEGVNFLDNAWCYNEGESERIMGTALRDGYRAKAVLMTKNHGRDAKTFRQQLEQSLQRLQTDYIDVLQFHEVIDDGVPQRIYSEGALEEAVKAREAGRIRFIGFTGHRWPHLHVQMLNGRVDWQTVQLPMNLLDYHYRSFLHTVMPILAKRDIGIIGMKSLAGTGANILKTGVGVREAIHYTLCLPIHTLVVGMDSVEFLRQDLSIVRGFTPLAESERQLLLAKVEPFAKDGGLEQYKSG